MRIQFRFLQKVELHEFHFHDCAAEVSEGGLDVADELVDAFSLYVIGSIALGLVATAAGFVCSRG